MEECVYTIYYTPVSGLVGGSRAEKGRESAEEWSRICVSVGGFHLRVCGRG
jgi:hypothetical protein